MKFFRHHLRVKIMCFFTIHVFWYMTPCRLANSLGGTCCLASIFIVVEEELTTLKMEAHRLSETPVTIYPVFPPTPLRCYSLETCNLYFSFRIRDQVPHPYKLTMKCSDFTHHLIFFFLLALQPTLGVVFHSPLAGFSLLAYEVS